LRIQTSGGRQPTDVCKSLSPHIFRKQQPADAGRSPATIELEKLTDWGFRTSLNLYIPVFPHDDPHFVFRNSRLARGFRQIGE